MMSDRSMSRKSRSFVRFAFATVLAGATLFQATESFALGTARQRAACMADVLRLCFTSIGSDQAVIACMTEKKDRLSKRCKMTLPPI